MSLCLSLPLIDSLDQYISQYALKAPFNTSMHSANPQSVQQSMKGASQRKLTFLALSRGHVER